MLWSRQAHMQKDIQNRSGIELRAFMSPALKDKSAFTPHCASSASPPSKLGSEFKVNLNHPNPKINYAYPKEQRSRVNP